MVTSWQVKRSSWGFLTKRFLNCMKRIFNSKSLFDPWKGQLRPLWPQGHQNLCVPNSIHGSMNAKDRMQIWRPVRFLSWKAQTDGQTDRQGDRIRGASLPKIYLFLPVFDFLSEDTMSMLFAPSSSRYKALLWDVAWLSDSWDMVVYSRVSEKEI